MNKKEFDSMVGAMKHSGLKEDDIIRVLMEAYFSKTCSLEDLEIMMNWLGQRLTDDFYKDNGIEPTGVLERGNDEN